MTKTLLLLSIFSFLHVSVFSFEKLPEEYHISYGNPKSPIKITEYFSLACPKCLKFINNDFPFFIEKYIHKGLVYWNFHPDPADFLTLQFMICLERLSVPAKQFFLQKIAASLTPSSLDTGAFVMEQLMNSFYQPISDLQSLSFIEKSTAFQAAYSYFKQKDVPNEIPTVEINGKIYQEFPSLEFLERKLETMLQLKESTKLNQRFLHD